MERHNVYLEYKRDTKYLLYWLINISNRIIKSSKDEATVAINTTGQTTVAGLIAMSKLIAQHDEPVPGAIFRLFGSIIQARTAINSAFQQLVGTNEDEDLKRSNASHKHFIDTLRQAFSILGGDSWRQDQSKQVSEDERDVEQVIVANMFKNLTVEADDDASSEEDEEAQPASAPRKTPRKPGKGKKGKKGKKAKKQKKTKKTPTAADADKDEIPMESVRIIEDADGIMTNYLMAVYTAVNEWIDLRTYVQGLWKEVAYQGLNGAVAGAVSNMAVSMIKQTSSAIFVDFPGHDSYETIMKTITRGDPNKAQGMFTIAKYAVDPQGRVQSKPEETAVDVKEQFLIYAYQDLVDFVTDFQLNRSGKPTKAMQAKIVNWDPKFNLRKATKQQRLDWRRSYTIKWLYDLVNVYSSIVVQRNTMKGEKHVYEQVDWSATGPWAVHRRLYGLNEFAGEITTMAMKKPGTDPRKMIQPHHVFHLQAIIDAFTVSRGWYLSTLQGHVLEAPAPGFRPRRDVDLFLDRENKRFPRGYCASVQIVKQALTKDGDRPELQNIFVLLQMEMEDFVNWLGESKYMSGLTTIPPSRFSDHDSNGLWEHSPFLCGVGLMEGLELAYIMGMSLWDKIPEPMLLIHLHNMLVQKGYLTRPVGLFQTLHDLMTESFFAGGRAPTSNFSQALLKKVGEKGAGFSKPRRQNAKEHGLTNDMHKHLDPVVNRFYQQKPTLLLCRQAEWNPDAIPDEELHFGTVMFLRRLACLNKSKIKDSPLFLRAKAAGIDEDAILEMADKLANIKKTEAGVPQAVIDSITPEGYRSMAPASLDMATGAARKTSSQVTGRDLLTFARADILSDVAGMRPFLSFNYLSSVVVFLWVFAQMEDRLSKARNRSYIDAYERPGPGDERITLVLLALADQDQDCLKIMGEAFEACRSGYMDYIYWDDLQTEPELMPRPSDSGPEACVVM
ncbi:hypothetical protein CEP51_007369 [Fusarium floridanum]|uniref:DUF6604 domain-containing protein n=1 Tax=Fusarium floridanum TaxID=1325733 RepID=A0A428RPM1_9HYPO|nr:hypothetical protein CEP51_007369 [Fusarium floridanum]